MILGSDYAGEEDVGRSSKSLSSWNGQPAFRKDVSVEYHSIKRAGPVSRDVQHSSVAGGNRPSPNRAGEIDVAVSVVDLQILSGVVERPKHHHQSAVVVIEVADGRQAEICVDCYYAAVVGLKNALVV